MWLEMDKDNRIVGLHNAKLNHPSHTWHHYQGDTVPQLEDRCIDGKIVKREATETRTNDHQRRALVERYIQTHFSLQTQLTLLVLGEPDALTRLRHFLQACQAWQDDSTQSLQALKAIKPD